MEEEEEIYSRQTILPEIGLEGQKRLFKSSILVAGLGGLGCAMLPYLAASGIGEIALLDFDKIERSNLARQTLYGLKDVGRLKCEAATSRLSAQFTKTLFSAKNISVEKEDLSPYDLILDGTDNAKARYWINDACKKLKKPWVYGSISTWQGQAALFCPEGADYRTLFPDEEHHSLPSCSMGGVLGPLAGCIGSIQALEAIQFLATGTSPLCNHLLTLDARTWRMKRLQLSERKAPNFELDDEKLKGLLKRESVRLINAVRFDPRDPIPKNQIIVFYCPSGIRSKAASEKVRKMGIESYYITLLSPLS